MLTLFHGTLVVAQETTFEHSLEQVKTELQQGKYLLSWETSLDAQIQAQTEQQKAQLAGIQGLVQYQMHHFRQAETLLKQAIQIDDAEKVHWLMALGDMHAKRGVISEAQAFYAQAASLPKNDSKITLAIQLAQIPFLPVSERLAELEKTTEQLTTFPDSQLRARYHLNLAMQAQTLGKQGVELAYRCLTQAQAETTEPRVLAEIKSDLAQLYETQNRFAEALHFNQQATELANRLQAHDLLLELEWRNGRLNKILQKLPTAMAAYQNAVEHIEAIRQDIPVEYHNGHSSFRETLEPVYLGLADLLLQQAAAEKEATQKNALLHRAREVVELIKQSEVEDFLGGRCGVHSQKNALLDSVEPKTAIIYPIVLPNRLELLVSVGKELHQFTQPVDAKTLQRTVKTMAHSLRTASSFELVSQSLYRWLIAPTESLLQKNQIQTLIMVPDGFLRLIPIGALKDEQNHFLVENYAIAISPGITLLEPSPLHLKESKVLLAGVSQPGGAIEHLPVLFLQDLGVKTERGLEVKKDNDDENVPNLPNNLMREPLLREKVQAQLSLPGVNKEMTNLGKTMPNTLLMNDEFTVDGFKQRIQDEPFNLIHIASHGIFGNSAETSFIMAYDNVININELEQILKSEKFEKQPIEMLTLSACQTAEGNDRAPLGLAGIALKAKVRSALGSLWSVSDSASARLMELFYQSLNQPNISKAQALQQAQLALIQEPDFAHPFYWSPFILVGNWL